MTDKESLTHEIEDDLAARNRNWNKVDRNTTNISDNATNISDNATNIDNHMLETAEDNVHGLSGAVIVESGSNAHGSYEKWGNGTMICYGTESFANVAINISTGALFGSGNLRWTYPLPFVGNPDVSVTPIAGTRRLWGQASTIGATSTIFLLTGTESVTLGSIDISLMAIGRWK